MAISHALWGGRFNPIIPVDHERLARQLVDFFRVDMLWTVSSDEIIRTFIAEFGHLPQPLINDELFVGPGERKSPQLVDIYHPIQRLHAEFFKNNPEPELSFKIYSWKNEERLADVLLCELGAVPTPDESGIDYLALICDLLRATDISLECDSSMPPLSTDERRVATIKDAFVENHYVVRNYGHRDGFFVRSAVDCDDLVTHWNLRATGTSIMFFDPTMAHRLEARKDSWLEILRSRPTGRHDTENAPHIWS